MDSPLIFIVADYGVGDLAFSEVKKEIKRRIPGAEIDYVSTQPFSSLSNGFCIYQLALSENQKYYIFSNTAPRRDKQDPRKKNEGEGLVYAKLKNEVEIIAALSGYTLSFIKPMIKALHAVKVKNYGSQFRSRDIYPEILAQIVNGDYSSLGRRISTKSILEIKRDRIAHTDGFGNIKLTTRASDMKGIKSGDMLEVKVGKKMIYGTYTLGIFGIKEGELSIAPGSSGPKDDRFIEISIRLGNAWKELGQPRVEERISIRRIRGLESSKSK